MVGGTLSQRGHTVGEEIRHRIGDTLKDAVKQSNRISET